MEQASLPPFESSALRAIQSVIASPNWLGNVLWLSLAALAGSVFIGHIALLGFGAEVLERRAGRPESSAVDIDSDRIGDYISKGIWPFLIQLLMQFVATVVIALPLVVLVLIVVGLAAQAGNSALLASMLIVVPLVIIGTVLLSVIAAPITIRAMVCQDFQESLDLAWNFNFVKFMFTEMVVSGFVFIVLSVLIFAVGNLALCVGAIPASGIIMGGYVHLLAQWYEVYLSRGGEPAPMPPGTSMGHTVVDAKIRL